jgi:predicted negative regulator of RcsB-dependent stress response
MACVAAPDHLAIYLTAQESVRMPQEPVIEALIVCPGEQPPSSASVLHALGAAGILGGEYQPPPAGTDIVPPAPGGRKKAGVYSASVGTTAAKVRVTVWRHGSVVTEGLGETALTALARGLSADESRVLREGTIALDLRQQPTGALRPLAALEFSLRVIAVLLDVSGGICLDPLAQRAFGRTQMARMSGSDPLAHISIHDEPWDADSRWLHTHGMQKFARPELDLAGVPVVLEPEGQALLRDVAVILAGGAELGPGDMLDLGDAGTAVAMTVATDVDHEAPYGRLRLVESAVAGLPASETATRLLTRAALAEAMRRFEQSDLAGAVAALERVLAADPDDAGALLLQARLRLGTGQPLAALEVAEYMELRLPDDYRGPFVAGLALAALGRPREAEAALDRALRLNPEAAEAFAARAVVRERLGDAAHAAEDVAHARYLGYRG